MSRTVDVTVYAETSASPEKAFDFIAPIDLDRIFDRWLLIPGVTGVRSQSGPWSTPGQTRVVLLSDGSEVREELRDVERPDGFTYRVGPFPGPLGMIAVAAEGEWDFSRDDGRTRVTWTYRFRPARLRRWLVLLLIAPMWRGYARRALRKAVAGLENAKAGPTSTQDPQGEASPGPG